MTDFLHNYSDVVVGMQSGTEFTDLTKYLTDFDLALDFPVETGRLGGRKTQWAVPTGSMLTAALNGYVLDTDTPKFTEIFANETQALFMIFYATARDANDNPTAGRAFAFNGFLNTDGIVRRGGVQQMNEPIMVTGPDWTARLASGDTPAKTDVTVEPNSYVFAYLTATPTANIAIGESPGDGQPAQDIPALSWTSASHAPSIYFHKLSAGSTRDVELGGTGDDKNKVLWAVKEARA